MKVLKKKSIKTSILKKFTRYEDVEKTKYKAVDIKKITKQKEKLLHYVDNNATTKIWNREATLEVNMSDKDIFL